MTLPEKSSSKSNARRLRIVKKGAARYRIRTRFQRYLFSGLLLSIYLMLALFFLSDNEDSGSDANILYLLGGALVSAVLGALVAPLVPRFLGATPKR